MNECSFLAAKRNVLFFFSLSNLPICSNVQCQIASVSRNDPKRTCQYRSTKNAELAEYDVFSFPLHRPKFRWNNPVKLKEKCLLFKCHEENNRKRIIALRLGCHELWRLSILLDSLLINYMYYFFSRRVRSWHFTTSSPL